MTVSTPDVGDLLVELADCINVLAEQQRTLQESLSALWPVVSGQWASALHDEGLARLPDQPAPTPTAAPAMPLHSQAVIQRVAGPVVEPVAGRVIGRSAEPVTYDANPSPAEPLVRSVPASDLKRDYDYFEELDARLAQLRADGESGGPEVSGTGK